MVRRTFSKRSEIGSPSCNTPTPSAERAILWPSSVSNVARVPDASALSKKKEVAALAQELTDMLAQKIANDEVDAHAFRARAREIEAEIARRAARKPKAIVDRVLHGEILAPKKKTKAPARSVVGKVISNQDQAMSAGPGDHRIAGVDGLRLVVGDNGSGNYIWRYRLAGRRREMGGSSRNRVKLAEAIDWAKDQDAPRRKNIDPVDERCRVRKRSPPRPAPPSPSLSARRRSGMSTSMRRTGNIDTPGGAGSSRSSDTSSRRSGTWASTLSASPTCAR